jgi:hypothetical protein
MISIDYLRLPGGEATFPGRFPCVGSVDELYLYHSTDPGDFAIYNERICLNMWSER